MFVRVRVGSCQQPLSSLHLDQLLICFAFLTLIRIRKLSESSVGDLDQRLGQVVMGNTLAITVEVLSGMTRVAVEGW